MIDYQHHGGVTIGVVSGVRIGSVQDALDLIAEASYEYCSRLVVGKHMLPGEFFSLKTGFAGEVLQKFSNYQMKLAVVGDFDNVQSNSLKCFIYECNNGRHVFFKKTLEQAIDALRQ